MAGNRKMQEPTAKREKGGEVAIAVRIWRVSRRREIRKAVTSRRGCRAAGQWRELRGRGGGKSAERG